MLNAYFALGPGAAARAKAYILDCYAAMGPAAQQFARSVPSSPEAIQASIQEFANIGTDELILYPAIAELDQVHRLTEIVGSEQ